MHDAVSIPRLEITQLFGCAGWRGGVAIARYMIYTRYLLKYSANFLVARLYFTLVGANCSLNRIVKMELPSGDAKHTH
jgi:hypothetical protein